MNFAVRLEGKLIGEAVLYNFDCRGGGLEVRRPLSAASSSRSIHWQFPPKARAKAWTKAGYTPV